MASLPAVSRKELTGLLAELTDGYEKHKPVFLALQFKLRAVEKAAQQIPKLRSPADIEVWNLEQYGLMREAQALRDAIRMPIESMKLQARKAEKAKEAEIEEEADLD